MLSKVDVSNGVHPGGMNSIRRLGLIGDVHAQHESLETALQFLESQNLDRVLCTGDIADGPPGPSNDTQRCIELLQQHQVGVVRGNHDRWLLSGELRELPDADSLQNLSSDAQSFLHVLPSTLPTQTLSGQLLLCHGMGNNDMQGLKPDDGSYAVQSKPELQALIEQQE